MRISLIPRLLAVAYASGKTFELRSAPGVGKSDSVEQFCASQSRILGVPFGLITFMLGTISQPDLGGFMYPGVDPTNPNGKRVSAFSLPPVIPHPTHFRDMRGGSFKVYVDGKAVDSFDGVPPCGIIFLDEYGQADLDLKKASADLMLNHRVRGEALPRGWGVVSASNRHTDRAGVTKDLSFVRNRITIVEIENTLEDWRPWALQNNVHWLVSGFASFKPSVVFHNSAPPANKQFASPRSVSSVGQMFTVMEQNGILDVDDESGMTQELVCGTIGEAEGVEQMAYARMATQLTTYEQIVADPKRVPLPPLTKADAIHALCNMVVTRVTEEHADKVFDYLMRMPTEYQIDTITSTVGGKPWLMRNKKFSKWVMDNRKLTVAATSA